MQNLAKPEATLREARAHMREGAVLYLVLNHPCYRIPRQSGWGVDEAKKLQYRRIDRYMTPMEIPIEIRGKEKTISFHSPLSLLTSHVTGAGFAITRMEEWCSSKESTGRCARMENRARKEFPLFLAIEAKIVES